MKKFPLQELAKEEFPGLLREIPDPPEKLFFRGTLPDQNTIAIAVVGSRKHSEYGKRVCERLIEGLAEQNIAIISGLALGIDTIAHKAALRTKIPTIAIPGSGLSWDILYPRTNVRLAEDILAAGGALLSEFDENFRATPWSFPQRNRIMAGLAQATLVIEAGERSGTLITARLAADYNRDVCVVPNDIFSPGSKGSNTLLKQGAHPITGPEDLLQMLGLDSQKTPHQETLPLELSPDEQKVFELLQEPHTKDELIRATNLPVNEATILLSAMEIKGLLVEKMGKVWRNI